MSAILKAKSYSCRFLESGVVLYTKPDGTQQMVYIAEENLPNIVSAFKGTNMIIDHQDVNIENAKEIKFGNAINTRIGDDKWGWCDFSCDNDEAINLINSGWNVSCGYVPTKTAGAGVHNNVPYDTEILEVSPLHIAIVKKPRYEKAFIIENSLLTNENEIMSNELLESIKNAIVSIPSAIKEGFKNASEDKEKKAKCNEDEKKEEDKKENEGKIEEVKVEETEIKKNKKYNGDEEEEIEIGDDKITIKEIANMLKAKKNEKKEEDEKKEEKEKMQNSLLNSVHSHDRNFNKNSTFNLVNGYELGKNLF